MTIEEKSSEEPKTRIGRPPKNGKAKMSAAERQKAYRLRKKERLEAIKNGGKVESKIIDLETDFKNLLNNKGI